MALEGQSVCGFIWARLVADNGPGGVNTLLGGTASTVGRIYRDRVPQTAPFPSMTITLVSHTDESTLEGARVFAVTLVDVRVVGSGSAYGTLNPIAARADAVLQNAPGSKDGVVVVELRRDGVQAFVEDEAGAMFSHVIQTYRTEAYAAP
jgi:hypothetical protein